jgi:2',5'-phosphodiesterase
MLAVTVCRRFFHYTSSNQQKIICRMAAYPDAYFRHKEGCDTFNYCFFLENEDLRVSRNFNFSRRITENIGEFQNRILTNVEKTLSKKRKKKSKDDATDVGEGIKVTFKADGEEVDGSKNCKEILSSSNVTMNVLGMDFKVLVNRPVVTAIALPDSMLADFPISPSKLDVEFGDRRNCLLTWYLSCNELPNDTVNKETLEYKEVARGVSFTPTPDDVNHVVKLKCQPFNGQEEGPAVEVVSKIKIEASPGHCPFDTRHKFTTEFLSGERLICQTFVCYI